MANEVIGEVRCPHHPADRNVRAWVKKSPKNGKMYYHCPECGLVMPTLGPFQLWLVENARLYSPGEGPDSAREPAEVVGQSDAPPAEPDAAPDTEQPPEAPIPPPKTKPRPAPKPTKEMPAADTDDSDDDVIGGFLPWAKR